MKSLLFAGLLCLSIYLAQCAPLETQDIGSDANLTKEELLLKLAEMILNSKAVQDLVKKEGRPLLAKGLEALDKVLHDLDAKVQKANPKTDIGKLALEGLEKLVAKAEVDLEAEIKKIQDEIHKPPQEFTNDIDDVMKTGEMLIERAQQLVAELKLKGRSLEAKGLALLEDVAIDALQKVKEYKPKTIVGQLIQKGLVRDLKWAEDKLDALIQKLLSHDNESYANLTKEELLLKLAEMILNSKAVQGLVKKEGRPLLAKGLEALDKVLHDLDAKVHKANPKTDIGKLALEGLEKLIAKAEVDLEAEIKKIQDEIHKPPTMTLSKEELLLKLAEMILNSKTVQDLVKKEGKPLLAKGLELLDKVLHDLDTKVHKANPKTEIGKLALEGLEKLIAKAEVDLEAEIKKIQDELHKPPQRFTNDIDDVVKTGEMLIERAKQLVAELQQKGRSTEAKALALLEEAAIDALQKVKDYKPITILDKLVQQGLVNTLKFAEEELDAFIQKLEPQNITKEELLLKLAEMILNSKTVQDLVKKEGRPLLAKGLELLDKVLHDLDAKVHKANPKTEIGKLALEGLEKLIAKAEVDLETEIKKIQDEIHKPPQVFTNDIDDVVKTSEMLIERAKQLVAELQQKGRSTEAKALALLEEATIDALQVVKEYKPITIMDKLVQMGLVGSLKFAEEQLDAFIQKIDP